MRSVLKENWLLKKIPRGTFYQTIALVILMFLGSNLFLRDLWNANSWMPASAHEVFVDHQYWRAWTTLFAHADATHLFSNMLLFFPFAYFLIGFYGILFFPLIGFFMGGLANLLVLKTMPENAHLIGVSGVVYWMGAAWATLAFFIDRREKKSRRFLKALGTSMILFLPETYQPEVSYLTHFVGYAFGIITAAIYYYLNRKKFHAAEKFEYFFEEEDSDQEGTNGDAVLIQRDLRD